MSGRRWMLVVAAAVVGMVVGRLGAQPAGGRGWQAGKGYGWIWGPTDEVGALNALGPRDVLRAVRMVREGRVYDLGVTYDRTSYKWPGHSPAEILSFRTPEGVKRQGDADFTKGPGNAEGTAWHSCAVFISDNIATQIDGLGHITAGEQDHWYNGFREAEWGGNWGVRKCGAETIPPIVARGILLDVAGHRKVDALPAQTRIGPKELQAVAAAQGVEIEPGDAVFIRTGTLRYWGETGADHGKIREHDSAGIDVEAARWLVGEKGAVLVGSDTSGLEVAPAPPGSRSFVPVHHYLLVEQGVHIAEFHNLEELARDRVYRFCYVCTVNKIKGATAGFALRPIALR
jgi:kynurenine formamidase